MKHTQEPHPGLSAQEAARRLAEHGPNLLREGGRQSPLGIFLRQLADVLVLVLLLAAGLSAALGDARSAAVILAVVVLNALLGTVQTLRARASLEGLKTLSAPQAKVLRDGQAQMIPGREVVPGDVVLLEAGDAVCADGRLLDCASLRCDESALTGESLPVEKDPEPLPPDTPLAQRRDQVFSGTFVTYGRGRFLVTATGMDTEMGKIAALLQSTAQRRTPLQQSLDRFGRRLSFGVLGLCGVLFAVDVLLRQQPVLDAFLFAVALAVAAIPEALSSIVTIVLSFGTRRLAKDGAVVRQLQAVEGLGSVSVICSDKTGTLTQNRMTVRQLYTQGRTIPAEEAEDTDPAQLPLIRAALLCSDAVVTSAGEVGDPTETALVRLGEAVGLDEEVLRAQSPRLEELPFDSERKRMSTLHRLEGERTLLCKGAADVLLPRCVLPAAERAHIQAVNEGFAAQGLRVLAFAEKRLPEGTALTPEEETDLHFLGLMALMDPPRPAAKQAVADCIAAGIRPVMITGDHIVTASAIAKEVGILTPGTRAVEGSALDALDDEELRALVPQVSVYARVTPEHKLRIIRAWQARGELAAMTGDGVNDAPALKQADIGVAMGRTGTQVAKEAAGMVLTDDDFATIVRAVENGRGLYANLCRSIHFLLSGNLAGIFTVLYAALLDLPVPFAAVQLLFLNLLTDSLPAIALGLEPHSGDVMHQPPRAKDAGILDRGFLARTAGEGAVLAAASIGAFHVGLQSGGAVLGSTMAFGVLCLSRLLHGFSCKSDAPVLFTRRFWNNPALLGAVGAGIVLLGAALFLPPVQPLLQLVPLSGRLAVQGLALALGSFGLVQLLRLWRQKKT